MSIQNLAIVFGPTLFGQGQQHGANGQLNGMADASLQNKVRASSWLSRGFSGAAGRTCVLISDVALLRRPSRPSWNTTPTSSSTIAKRRSPVLLPRLPTTPSPNRPIPDLSWTLADLIIHLFPALSHCTNANHFAIPSFSFAMTHSRYLAPMYLWYQFDLEAAASALP